MSTVSQPLLTDIRTALAAKADPARAPEMQRYLKSTMPCLGLQMPYIYAVCKAVYAEHRLLSFEAWRDTVLALWHEATYREERYAALILAGHEAYDDYQRMTALPMYRDLIVSGAWWDLVDDVATHRISELLRRFPGPMTKMIRAWADSKDMWLRRAAILSQIGFKKEIDRELLYDCIQPSIDSKEFFLRKAIGWALRDYAKTDPADVLRYVKQHRVRLSGLTKREALKAQLRSGELTDVP